MTNLSEVAPIALGAAGSLAALVSAGAALVRSRRHTDVADKRTGEDVEVVDVSANNEAVVLPRRQRWFRWPILTTAIGLILVGALFGTILEKAIIGAQPTGGPSLPCATGTANLAGSSAFGPVLQTIADDYMKACPGSHVVINTDGSIDGVRTLTNQGPPSGDTHAALSDGPSAEAPNDMGRQQLAVLVYALLVNKAVGVDHLTTDQVRGIYSGNYTNWSQLGGNPLPIRIAGREGGSSIRRTLEQYVLQGSEGVPSSNNCQTKDQISSAPTTLCELPTTADVVNAVSTVPGAIGYADIANPDTSNAVSANRVVPVVLDGRSPRIESPPGYPFRTVEYLYTWTPGIKSPIGAFAEYLKSDSAQAVLRDAGYVPCAMPGGSLDPLCTQR